VVKQERHKINQARAQFLKQGIVFGKTTWKQLLVEKTNET
jgi:hypothetical protein